MNWTFQLIVSKCVFEHTGNYTREQADRIAEDLMYRCHVSVDYWETDNKDNTLLTCEYE